MGLRGTSVNKENLEMKTTRIGGDLAPHADYSTTTDILAITTVLAGIGVAVYEIGEWVSEMDSKDPIQLGYGRHSDEGVDKDFSARSYGDHSVFHSSLTDAKYEATFRGIMHDNSTNTDKISIDILRTSPSGDTEVQHVLLDSYARPASAAEALARYDKLLSGKSANDMALLNFAGNKDFHGIDVLVYAQKKGDGSVDIKVAEDYLALPAGFQQILSIPGLNNKTSQYTPANPVYPASSDNSFLWWYLIYMNMNSGSSQVSSPTYYYNTYTGKDYVLGDEKIGIINPETENTMDFVHQPSETFYDTKELIELTDNNGLLENDGLPIENPDPDIAVDYSGVEGSTETTTDTATDTTTDTTVDTSSDTVGDVGGVGE